MPRARWRRYAGLGLCACCLPLALRLLLLGSGSGGSGSGIEVPGQLTLGSRIEDGSREAGERNVGTTRSRDGGVVVVDGSFVGAYMAERRPGNVSYCRWQYGLPGSLRYLDQQLIVSPEAPASGGRHRVLPFVVRGANEGLPQVSLCTHASADQVYGVVELARRWEGPLGLAVFVPGLDAALAVRLLERACHCEPAMSKVSVHLIFPRDRPAILGPKSSATQNKRPPPPPTTMTTPATGTYCSALELQRAAAVTNSTERRRLGIAYPINVARNVARALAPTQRVLVSDVELLPSERLASRFASMLRGRSPKRAIAFVLPVFEIEAGERPPRNKRELLAALRAGLAVYFHRFSCPHCQRFPGLTRWILRPDPGRVRPLIITRREYPHHRWEPIFIGTKHDPLYTEEMSWEGRQDKMTQMFEMCLMNYRLIILDGAFLVHTPGIKRKPADDIPQQRGAELQRAYERQNAHIYQSVTRRLLKQYPANRRCRP